MLLPHTATPPVVESPVSVAGPVEVSGSVVTAAVLSEEEEDDSAGPLLLVSAGLVLDSALAVVESTLVLELVSSTEVGGSSPGHAARVRGRDDRSRERQASDVTRGLYRLVGRS